jgi:hypothetical protein
MNTSLSYKELGQLNRTHKPLGTKDMSKPNRHGLLAPLSDILTKNHTEKAVFRAAEYIRKPLLDKKSPYHERHTNHGNQDRSQNGTCDRH